VIEPFWALSCPGFSGNLEAGDDNAGKSSERNLSRFSLAILGNVVLLDH
jgi:hypothetical protein